jgi:hypothetical protein
VLDGIYYSQGWATCGLLWAYRFYTTGPVLFTCVARLGPLVFHTPSGPILCSSKEVLGTRERVREFAHYFSLQEAAKVTYRSGLLATSLGSYLWNGSTVSFSHPYFEEPCCFITGCFISYPHTLSLQGVPPSGRKGEFADDADIFVRLICK